MIRRYSEYSREELTQEIDRLHKEMEATDSAAHTEVLLQKANMAKSYLLLGTDFPKGIYWVEGKEERFTLERLNGIMAWGRWESGEEGAVPISTLKKRP